MKLQCINCNKEVEAKLVTGAIIYPHRPDLAKKYFYKCPICGEYVGCHPSSTKPLGCIPSKELRQARIKELKYMKLYLSILVIPIITEVLSPLQNAKKQ